MNDTEIFRQESRPRSGDTSKRDNAMAALLAADKTLSTRSAIDNLTGPQAIYLLRRVPVWVGNLIDLAITRIKQKPQLCPNCKRQFRGLAE